MIATLSADEKHMLSVTVAKLHGVQALLRPMIERSLLIEQAHVKLREANIFLALAMYEKIEEHANSAKLSGS